MFLYIRMSGHNKTQRRQRGGVFGLRSVLDKGKQAVGRFSTAVSQASRTSQPNKYKRVMNSGLQSKTLSTFKPYTSSAAAIPSTAFLESHSRPVYSAQKPRYPYFPPTVPSRGILQSLSRGYYPSSLVSINPKYIPIASPLSRGARFMSTVPRLTMGTKRRKDKLEKEAKTLTYSTLGSFPIKDSYTADDIMSIDEKAILGIYRKVFGEPLDFKGSPPSLNDARATFIAHLKEKGKFSMGVNPELMKGMVSLSPNDTLKEGAQAAATVMPSTETVFDAIQVAGEISKSSMARINEAEGLLTQQAQVFIMSIPELAKFQDFLLQGPNIKKLTQFMGAEINSSVFFATNQALVGIIKKAVESNVDLESIRSTLTTSRLDDLKKGLVNVYVNEGKEQGVANIRYLLMNIQYNTLTPMTLDLYLTQLVTEPSTALDTLKSIYSSAIMTAAKEREEAKKLAQKQKEEPIKLEKMEKEAEAKGKGFTWGKGLSFMKGGAIVATVIILASMYGYYSVWDVQKAAAQYGSQIGIRQMTESSFQEMEIIGKSIQEKAIEPVMEAMKPVTEPVSQKYEDLTKESRRKQYTLLRLYDSLFRGESSKGGVRNTRKLLKN